MMPGRISEARIPMMLITTNNSIKVKPDRDFFCSVWLRFVMTLSSVKPTCLAARAASRWNFASAILRHRTVDGIRIRKVPPQVQSVGDGIFLLRRLLCQGLKAKAAPQKKRTGVLAKNVALNH
jgi:hypothetical protein